MGTNTTLIQNNPMHAGLAATARSHEIPETMDLYGWLVGSWELDVVGYDDEGNVIHTTGEAHGAWVLEGRAVQDVFINPRRSDRGPDSPKFANWFGTTLRIYDPVIQAWRVYWFNPHDGIRAALVGHRHGQAIVQEGEFPDGTPIRWTFSEITADSFRWRGERLEPDKKNLAASSRVSRQANHLIRAWAPELLWQTAREAPRWPVRLGPLISSQLCRLGVLA